MEPLAQNGSSFGHGNPNAILNECRDIDRGIDTVEQNLEQLRMIQQRTLDDADSSGSSAANRQLDSLSADTMSLYRELTERVRTIKSSPEASSAKNNPHVTRIDRRLKAAITQYQQVESQFRKRTQDQMARQYRIVRPDASEQEIQAAVEDTTGGQVFSQAMMQSDRQGRARAALSAVQDRHQALQKIEQQMVELAQLFQDMDTLVVQQEAAVTQIEQKGEEVVENLDKGNQEIGVAVNTARKTRKKKWICLGICGMYHRFEFAIQQFANLKTQWLSLSSSSLSSSSTSLLSSKTTTVVTTTTPNEPSRPPQTLSCTQLSCLPYLAVSLPTAKRLRSSRASQEEFTCLSYRATNCLAVNSEGLRHSDLVTRGIYNRRRDSNWGELKSSIRLYLFCLFAYSHWIITAAIAR